MSTAVVKSTARASMSLEPALQSVVERIHACPTKSVVYLTGGATQALGWLMSVPGASSTILEANVQYSKGSLVDLLGKEPGKYVSADTAREMAKEAYKRAVRLSPPGTPVVGIGCTCALASSEPKKGKHQCKVAAHSSSGVKEMAIEMAKGQRSRWEEDDATSRILLRALSLGCGFPAMDVPLDLIPESGDTDGDKVTSKEQQFSDPLQRLFDGDANFVEFAGDQVHVDVSHAKLILPGSFNPLHKGHRKLLKAAMEVTGGKPAAFEISAGNADKGFQPEGVIRRRVEGILEAKLPVVITNAPLFSKKADYFPGCTFVVGYDTAVRLIMDKYYDSHEGMLEAMANLRTNGCDFLVAGRYDTGRGAYLTLDSINFPHRWIGEMFKDIPEDKFREDISSSEIREAEQATMHPLEVLGVTGGDEDDDDEEEEEEEEEEGVEKKKKAKKQ